MLKIIKYTAIILVIIAVLAGCAVSTSIGSGSRHEKTVYPEVAFPQLGAPKNELLITVSSDFEVSDISEQVNVYKVIKPDIKRISSELSSRFELRENYQSSDNRLFVVSENELVEINTDTGFWFYQNRKVYDAIYNSTTPSKLNKDQCIEIAKKIALENGVDLAMFSDIQVANIELNAAPAETDIKSNPPIVIGHDVYFYPVIDNKSVWGIARFIVTLDSNGNTASINKYYPELEYYATEKIINSEDALNFVINQKGHIMSVPESDADAIKLTKCGIVYYLDVESSARDEYCLPVYAFAGKYSLKEIDEKENGFSAIISAIRQN